MRLHTKILGGFMIITIVALTLGIMGLVSTVTLNNITEELKQLQHENDSISKVLNAHYVWRQGLTESVLTGSEFTGALDPNTCALGIWYQSDQAKNMDDPHLMNMLAKIDDPHEFIHNEAKNVVALVQAGELEKASNYLENVIFPRTTEVISILTEIQTEFTGLVEEKNAESAWLSRLMEIIGIALILVAVAVCLFLAFLISGMISKPIVVISNYLKRAGETGDLAMSPAEREHLSMLAKRKDEIADLGNSVTAFVERITAVDEALETVAGGDLTIEIALLSDKDEMGMSLKTMTENLNSMFDEINVNTTLVSAEAKQIADGSIFLAQGATEQAASISQLSSAIEEIAERATENARIAIKTSILSETIMQNAEKGSRHMDEMIHAVDSINEASKAIEKIIKTIDDIAFRTNILAINATIEAARAGEHGKGFAVVADEVRSLASKSAEAAKDTGNIIQNSMEKAELGSRIAGETAASLKEIVSGIKEASQLVTGIAKSSEEQSLGVAQINVGIDQVAQVVQQNSATAQESAAASEQMSSQSEVLLELVSHFKLKESNIQKSAPPVIDIRKKRHPSQAESDIELVSGDDYNKY